MTHYFSSLFSFFYDFYNFYDRYNFYDFYFFFSLSLSFFLPDFTGVTIIGGSSIPLSLSKVPFDILYMKLLLKVVMMASILGAREGSSTCKLCYILHKAF